MVDLILELIDFNESIDYSVVSTIVIVYLALLWVFVSIWVFNDARYRFNNSVIAFFLAILNLFLSFPFLLIYLLIRPSHREDWDDLNEEGGVNIPIVNFTGKDGVVISLQLKIDSKKLLEENIDYKLDVALTKDDKTVLPGRIEIVNEMPQQTDRSDTLSPAKPNKFKLFLASLASPFRRAGRVVRSKVTGLKTPFKSIKSNNQNHQTEDQGENENQNQQENVVEQAIDNTSKSKKKKNKSKKKKRK